MNGTDLFTQMFTLQSIFTAKYLKLGLFQGLDGRLYWTTPNVLNSLFKTNGYPHIPLCGFNHYCHMMQLDFVHPMFTLKGFGQHKPTYLFFRKNHFKDGEISVSSASHQTNLSSLNFSARSEGGWHGNAENRLQDHR